MNHGSLFSGIGGFDLAAEWMGWENIFHCEWMPSNIIGQFSDKENQYEINLLSNKRRREELSQESIKGYGNAIVPQVAYEIFKTIEHLHNEKLQRPI